MRSRVQYDGVFDRRKVATNLARSYLDSHVAEAATDDADRVERLFFFLGMLENEQVNGSHRQRLRRQPAAVADRQWTVTMGTDRPFFHRSSIKI